MKLHFFILLDRFLMCFLSPICLLQVEYKLGFQVHDPMAMALPQANISLQGEVPRTLSGELPTPIQLLDEQWSFSHKCSFSNLWALNRIDKNEFKIHAL